MQESGNDRENSKRFIITFLVLCAGCLFLQKTIFSKTDDSVKYRMDPYYGEGNFTYSTKEELDPSNSGLTFLTGEIVATSDKLFFIKESNGEQHPFQYQEDEVRPALGDQVSCYYRPGTEKALELTIIK